LRAHTIDTIVPTLAAVEFVGNSLPRFASASELQKPLIKSKPLLDKGLGRKLDFVQLVELEPLVIVKVCNANFLKINVKPWVRL